MQGAVTKFDFERAKDKSKKSPIQRKKAPENAAAAGDKAKIEEDQARGQNSYQLIQVASLDKNSKK